MDTVRITEMKYTRRVNLGDYNHEETTVGAMVEEGADPSLALQQLKDFVNTGKLTLTLSAPEEKAVKKPKKAAAKETEPIEGNLKQTTTPQPPEKEEPKEEPKKEAAPTPKAKKSKATPYNRNLETHKKLMGETLDKIYPEWRKDNSKAREVSAALEGVDFLDEEGKVLESFADQVREGMKK